MPYTFRSLVFLWVIIFGLFALAGSGVVAGPWLLLVLAVALAAPAVVLTDSVSLPAPARAYRPDIR